VSDTRFPREERLKLRNRIAHLFETGRRFSEGPVQVLWCLSSWPMERSAQVLVGAPKRRFKHAVDRNRFKRLLREAYRLERQDRLASCPPILLGFLYQGAPHMDLATLRSHVAAALGRVSAEAQKASAKS
jgi:ribonuclease P protein component